MLVHESSLVSLGTSPADLLPYPIIPWEDITTGKPCCFVAWHGESGEGRNPLVFPVQMLLGRENLLGPGFYFTPDETLASSFVAEGYTTDAYVITAHNPYVLRGNPLTVDDLLSILDKASGHDVVILEGPLPLEDLNEALGAGSFDEDAYIDTSSLTEEEIQNLMEGEIWIQEGVAREGSDVYPLYLLLRDAVMRFNFQSSSPEDLAVEILGEAPSNILSLAVDILQDYAVYQNGQWVWKGTHTVFGLASEEALI